VNTTLTITETITDTIRSFFFKKPEGFEYLAGQYVKLTLPHDNPDDRGIERWFTISSSPTEDDITITTKIIDKCSSFKATLAALQPGDPIKIDVPEGDFVLPEDTTKQLVFIVGGIGITPCRSIIKYLSDKNEHRDITVLYGLRDESEAAYTDLITNYGAKLVKLIGQPLTSKTLLPYISNPSDKQIYISGPAPMVSALTKELLTAGIAQPNLRSDYFDNYTEL
jgi:ferredoxin-NADP reductase